jgi:hypothetical protein
MRSGVNIAGYAVAYTDGATHAEMMEAVDRGMHLIDYADLREDGVSHKDALAHASS